MHARTQSQGCSAAPPTGTAAAECRPESDVHTPQQRVPQTTKHRLHGTTKAGSLQLDGMHDASGHPQQRRTRTHVCVARKCLLIVCSSVNESTACRGKSACSASTCTLETLSQPHPTLRSGYIGTTSAPEQVIACQQSTTTHSGMRKANPQAAHVHPAISAQSQLHTTSCMQHSMDASHAEQRRASKQADKAMHTHNE